MTRELTGRHVFLIAFCSFGVIVAANMAMLFAATGSFPGLVVKNSYVASQGWNARTAAQAALGWTSVTRYRNGEVHLEIADNQGVPVRGLELSATVGRPSTDAEDRLLVLTETEDGYTASALLDPGLWRVRVRTTGTPRFEKTAQLFVRDPD